MIDLLVLGLATFRLSRLVSIDDGPFGIFARLRAMFITEVDGICIADNAIGQLLMCPYWCLTIWTGGFAVLTWYTIPIMKWFWLWLAVSQIGAIVGLTENKLAR